MGRDSLNRQTWAWYQWYFFDTWIRPLEVYGVEGSTLYILVPSEQMTLSYISKKYYLPLKVTIAELTGTEYEIKFILPEQTKNIRTGNNGVPKKMHFPKRRTDQIWIRTIHSTRSSSAAITVLRSRRHLPLLNLRVKHTILSIFMEDRDLENSPYAFHRSFYIREKPERKSTLCYIRRIYQRSNRVNSKW